jgi:hypothetical protein
MPPVGPEPPAGSVDDRPRTLAEAGVAGQEGALSLAGEEAQILALALAGDREPGGGGELSHPRLGQVGERKAQRTERPGRERREHVGLVLGLVRRLGEQRALAVVHHPRVVAGGEARGARAPR